MAMQPSITEFFTTRKRPATDDAKRNLQPCKKVMILENDEGDVSVSKIVDDNQIQSDTGRKVICFQKEDKGTKTTTKVKNKLTKKNVLLQVLETKKKINNIVQTDIRKTFGAVNGKTTSSVVKPTENKCEELKNEELNLMKIKSKINKSSKRDELKAALAKLNNGFAKLDTLQQEKKLHAEEKLQLNRFDTITIETTIPSPCKTPVKMGMSPAKLREEIFKSPGRKLNMEPVYISPRKLFDTMPAASAPPSPLKSPTKSPAFQRYQALVTDGKTALTLPFKYRSLAETFRAVDTIVSMLNNRRETVTFSKLKSAVQEMLRRNLYEKHLGQIKAVFEGAYQYQYEKIYSMGSKTQPDKIELVIKPVLKEKAIIAGNDDSEVRATRCDMTPDVLLERRRFFYGRLLEKAKIHHEEFLARLDPPLVVPRDSLTRWHPEFDVDGVPDVEPTGLPEPPNAAKVSTAKDVLDKARNLFNSNPRMERALQKVSEQQNGAANPSSTYAGNTGPAVAALTNALKGIPKSLLEKVRAKQAAKAMEAMTRSPLQAKEAIRLTRLPEIARIVRNTFISEKKSVLTRELILKKLSDSYRENLGFRELDSHLNLLQEKTPEWLSFCTLRKTDYVRFVKDADMSLVMAKLENLATENSY